MNESDAIDTEAPRTLPLVMAEPRGRAQAAAAPRRPLAGGAHGATPSSSGLPAFRARQVSTHYFDRLVDDPAEMTDLPADQRDELVVGVPADR